jgi:hypothetical protein
MVDKLTVNKLNQIESNIKKYIDQNFKSIIEYIDSNDKRRKQNENEPDWSVDYFLECESSDIDLILANEEDAESLIDAILVHKVNYENPETSFYKQLKTFSTFNLCK